MHAKSGAFITGIGTYTEDFEDLFNESLNITFDRSRISYRNGRNTEALIFENLKPVEITKKNISTSFEHLKKSINFQN